MSEARPAVVYDINVLVSAVTAEDSDYPYLAQIPPATSNPDADCLSIAFDADDFRLFVSPHIMNNLARVLAEGYHVKPATVEAYIGAILDLVEISGGAVVDPPRAVFDVADHEDQLILDLALDVGALIVVSNDTDLTAVSPWHNRVAVLRPREFVNRTIQNRRRPR